MEPSLASILDVNLPRVQDRFQQRWYAIHLLQNSILRYEMDVVQAFATHPPDWHGLSAVILLPFFFHYYS